MARSTTAQNRLRSIAVVLKKRRMAKARAPAGDWSRPKRASGGAEQNWLGHAAPERIQIKHVGPTTADSRWDSAQTFRLMRRRRSFDRFHVPFYPPLSSATTAVARTGSLGYLLARATDTVADYGGNSGVFGKENYMIYFRHSR